MSHVELTEVEIKIYVKVFYYIPFPKIGDGESNDGLSKIYFIILLHPSLLEFSGIKKYFLMLFWESVTL